MEGIVQEVKELKKGGRAGKDKFIYYYYYYYYYYY